MKFIIVTALAVLTVRGQMIYTALLPTQYQKFWSSGSAYPISYPQNFRPYPMNNAQNFHPYPVNYPMDIHSYPIMQVSQMPIQVPQNQNFLKNAQSSKNMYEIIFCPLKNAQLSENACI